MNRSKSRSSELQSAIWLIGIGILWLTDMWWPGILILIGISTIVGAAFNQREEAPARAPVIPVISVEEPAPEEPVEDFDEDAIPDPTSGRVTRNTPAAPARFVPVDPSWLPAACPACGGPLKEVEVTWHAEKAAECPFCHTLLDPSKV